MRLALWLTFWLVLSLFWLGYVFLRALLLTLLGMYFLLAQWLGSTGSGATR